ncbi:multicopper oxidase domain-containing protein [Candidatus Korobacter versatilis]|uniref:multicopper oxidase domain-containing protein n=1 Tax=Candidatus Korobacter versatilis TaxID=658062 RepID=UPI0011D0AB6A|nr:multicopper oxidase domain-containing protein [Candidatus Koribacter versatilis]
MLTIHLELRSGLWRPEAEDGPELFVQAFGEEGKPAQVPGPMMRVPAGTTIHATVKNTLKVKAILYGLHARPGDAKDSFELKPEESREVTFAAGDPGTYFYSARTSTDYPDLPPLRDDAQLNGAFIVDDPRDTTPDRVFVINTMFVKGEVFHPTIEILSINGKIYPFTEPLEYTEGEAVRWRVLNPGVSEHPMHLHGAFFNLLSVGSAEKEAKYAPGERQSVVTEDMVRASTMMMEWKPPHEGRWLFHCHFHAHISHDERVPVMIDNIDAAPPKHEHHDMMMSDMAGLVMAINVKPRADKKPAPMVAAARKVDLVVEPTTDQGKSPTFSCSVREGKKIVASQEKAMGPPIVVTRGEAVEITVLNHLKVPTTIHWHGIELESYYDGVMGGGSGSQMTPAIAPGESFVAKFTPNRAGTFIYHTHAATPEQLSGGVYGALIVLDPGQTYDPEHDRLLVIGTRDADFYAKRITINGSESPNDVALLAGVKYRLRVINMAPELMADLQFGTAEHPATWRAIAKDGAALPARLVKSGDAKLHIASGETYDFEFQPQTKGDVPIEVKNTLNDAKTLSRFVVQ